MELIKLVRRVAERMYRSRKPGFPASRRKLQFENLEVRDLLTAGFTSFQLSTDTGVSAQDRITSDATLSGTVEWTAPEICGVTVEFDHDGDGQAEGAVPLGNSGDSFSYDPAAVDGALASWEAPLTVFYRAVTHGSGGDVPGEWFSFGMTLDRIPPSVVEFAHDAEVLMAAPTETAVVFSEPIDASTLTSANASVENVANPSGEASNVQLASPDSATIVLDESLAGGQYETHVEGIADLAGNTMAAPRAASWRIAAAPTALAIPSQNVDNSSTASIRLADYFFDEYDAVGSLAFSIADRSQPSPLSNWEIIDDLLTLEPAPGASGTADLEIVATDSDGHSVVTTVLVYVTPPQNNAPQIVGFFGYEEPYSWSFDGQVVDENPVGLTVVFGGLLEGHSVVITDPSGFFWYGTDVTQDGSVTARTTDWEGLPSNVAWTDVIRSTF